MGKLAIVGASGKLGFATLNAILDRNMIPASDLICTTSSSAGASKLQSAIEKGMELRSANWDDKSSFVQAFKGCEKVFLISSARVDKDYNEAPYGHGREADHFTAIDAAKESGIKHIFYTSLAFQNPSLSRVMTAHERTEQYLANCGIAYTSIREGLYSESWPLYFGHFDVKPDRQTGITVAGDGKINWTSIPDLGLANALIITDTSERWAGKTVYLAQSDSHTLQDLAAIISRARDQKVLLKIVSRRDHEAYYVNEVGMEKPFVEWWSKTYDALRAGECEVSDPTLENLLGKVGVRPQGFEDTVLEMLK